MRILGLRMKEMEYYGENDTIDYIYYVIDEGDDIMIPKLKKLETICGNYDSYEEVEDYIRNNFKRADVSVIEYIV